MIFETHDRHQIEFRSTFSLAKSGEKRTHEVDTWIFIPHSVGLNALNYSRDEFYADTTALMRLDAPAQPLGPLMDDWSIATPLRQMVDALKLLEGGERVPSSLGLAAHAKLFAFVQTQAVA